MKKSFLICINRLFITILALAAAFVLTACGEEKELPAMEQGFNELKAGNYQAAINLFYKAGEEGTSQKEIDRALGMCESLKGNYEEAIKYYTQALSDSNGIIKDIDIDITYYRAIAEMKLGNTADAIKAFDSIIAINPKDDNAYYMRGKAYLASGNKSKAIEDYDMTLSLAPNDFDHYLRICEDLSDCGYENEGKNYISKAKESFSKLSDYQQGVLDYYLGDYNRARTALEKAKQSKNSPEDTVIFLARAYEMLGDYDYAAGLYEECAAAGKKAACAYLGIGDIKMKQGDYQSACEAFEKGIQVNDPDYIKTLEFNRIVSYEYLRDFAKAKSLMAEYIIKYPDDEKARRENVFLSTR